jgi:hypothetical protein
MSEIQTEVDVAKPLLMGQNKNDKDEITLSARVPPEPKQYVSMLRKSNRNKQKSKNSITAKGEEPIPKKQKKTGTTTNITKTGKRTWLFNCIFIFNLFWFRNFLYSMCKFMGNKILFNTKQFPTNFA